ncbi:hypothetical protein C1T17_06180 [Sphingobium sp. SCG-1]|nr:hypothetical protein C1T17_06180 [Sphingobium sp. SCG-1]
MSAIRTVPFRHPLLKLFGLVFGSALFFRRSFIYDVLAAVAPNKIIWSGAAGKTGKARLWHGGSSPIQSAALPHPFLFLLLVIFKTFSFVPSVGLPFSAATLWTGGFP